MTTPLPGLRVVVIAHAADAVGGFPHAGTFAESIRTAFTGIDSRAGDSDHYLRAGTDTGAEVLQFLLCGDAPRGGAPDPAQVHVPEPALLDDALHTVVVVLLGETLLGGNDQVAISRRIEQLTALLDAAEQDSRRHAVRLLALCTLPATAVADTLARRVSKPMNVEELGEYALRPSYASMLVLHDAHGLLAEGVRQAAAEPPPAVTRARLFVSHAKLDGLPLAGSVNAVLAGLPWLGSFYDTRDISNPDDLEQTILQGVHDCMLVALRTDLFDQRPWCRREVMWAEEQDRPMLMVDARTSMVMPATSLAFAGVPWVRVPDGNLVRVIAEALREWVRIGVARRRFVEACAAGTDQQFLSRPPTLQSLAFVVRRMQARGTGRRATLVHTGAALDSGVFDAAGAVLRQAFPRGRILPFSEFMAGFAMMRRGADGAPPGRPLAGMVVGISVAASEELATLGFDEVEVNRTTVRLAEALLGAGARLAFGHDWRPGGVMEAIATLAMRYFDPAAPVEAGATGQSATGAASLAPILSLVAWPDRPFLQSERADARDFADSLRGVVATAIVPAPPGARAEPGSPAARANALSAMRRELTRICHARVCVGGRMTAYSGWWPGVAEEAALSLSPRNWPADDTSAREEPAGVVRPIVLSALFGGASARVLATLTGEEVSDRDWRRPREVLGGVQPIEALALPRIERTVRGDGHPGIRIDSGRSVDQFVEATLASLVDFAEGFEGLPRVAAAARRAEAALFAPDADDLIAELQRADTPPQRRLAIGARLAELGDDRAGVGLRADGVPDIEWRQVPAGAFVWQAGERRELPTYFVSRYPVTNAHYQAFIDARGYEEDRWWQGLAKRSEAPMEPHWGEANRPRESVTWYEAVAFCRWLSSELGYEVRLPVEQEWEKAARGPDGREYPWGGSYLLGYANVDETATGQGAHYLGQTTAVGVYPQGASVYRVEDLSGNVWEWCLNEYEKPDDEALSVSLGGSAPRALRGGSWGHGPVFARAALRFGFDPVYRVVDWGFRLVCASPIS